MPEIELDSEVQKIGWFSYAAMVYEVTEYPRENDSPFAVRKPHFLGVFLTRGRAEKEISDYLGGI